MARPPLRGWPGRMWRAARFTARRPDAWTVALAAFLARGGIVLLLLPIVVVPSVIALAASFGVGAVTIAGQPTAWLITVVVVAAGVAIGWLLVSGLLAGETDVWLVRACLGGTPHFVAEREGLALRLLAIRVLCLAPLGLVAGWAALGIGFAAYRELQVPSDLATPFPIRVVVRTGPEVAAGAITWLAMETLAGIAVRRAILLGTGIARSLGGAAVEIVRRPISTLATVVVAYVPSAITIGAFLIATALAFDAMRVAARTPPGSVAIQILARNVDVLPLLLLGAALGVALAWLAALIASAATAAWRSAALTAEVADAVRQRTPTVDGDAPSRPDSLGLSRQGPERTGD